MGHLMGGISYEKVYFLVELPVCDLTTKIDFVSFEKYDFLKPFQLNLKAIAASELRLCLPFHKSKQQYTADF